MLVLRSILLLSFIFILPACVTYDDNGGSGYYSPYAWDRFYTKEGKEMWRCREKSSGQFAKNENCAGLVKSDNIWPG